MRILVAPDSFKGSINAERFCKVIGHAAKRVSDTIECVAMPLADGGEGTAALVARALGASLEKIEVEGPSKKNVRAQIAFLNGGKVAVIESAQAVGMTLSGRRTNPIRTSSYGVGQMISYATSKGAEHIVLTLGGSCTNDLGTGMLSAMGVSFVDICGNRFAPVGGSMERVESIEFNQAFSKYRGVKFTVLCDVNNPLLGENGCAAVFAPQKGAGEADVARLEKGAQKLVSVVTRVTGTDMKDEPGAGAAGGIGYGAMSFLQAKRESGIDAVFKMYNFRAEAVNADLIVTGEGCFDGQSLMGKAVGGVLENRGDTPCVIFCGNYDETPVPDGVTVVPIGEGVPLEEAMANAPERLLTAAEKYFRELQ